MSKEQRELHPLVEALERAGKDGDRAALAQLRTSMAEGREALAYPFVARFFGDSERENANLVLVAQLFALHPKQGCQSLATALRVPAGSSDSVEMRLRALLDADREDLPVHLRHAISLARAHDQAVDYDDILHTLRFWDGPHSRRRRWARDFWFQATTDNAQEGTAS